MFAVLAADLRGERCLHLDSPGKEGGVNLPPDRLKGIEEFARFEFFDIVGVAESFFDMFGVAVGKIVVDHVSGFAVEGDAEMFGGNLGFEEVHCVTE